MKIAAAAPPLLVSRNTPTLRADMPTGAFEALLRGADQPRGFADLGMFGRRPEVVETADRADEPQAPPDHPTASVSDDQTAIAAAPKPQTALLPTPDDFASGVARIVLRETAEAAAATTRGPAAFTAQVDGPVEIFVLATAPSGEPVEGPEATAAPPAKPDAPPPSGSSLSVVVADQPDGLRVIIGGLTLAPPAQDRLRRKIAELATELGLALSELSLNGETLDPSFPLALGDVHGDRVR